MQRDDDDDESRPTTALNPGELRELVAEARTPEVRGTEGVAPIVMIVDRPKELAPNTQREIATRMMQPIEMHSLGHAPIVAEPPKPRPAVFDRRPTGGVVEAPRISWRPYLLAACLVASVLLLLL